MGWSGYSSNQSMVLVMVIVIHICDSGERAQVSLKECGGISAERLC